jgi:hypothetical protein
VVKKGKVLKEGNNKRRKKGILRVQTSRGYVVTSGGRRNFKLGVHSKPINHSIEKFMDT